MMTMERLVVRVDKRLNQQLSAIARRRGISKSALMRTALEAFCRGDEEPTAFDLAQRAGIIGLVKDAPVDLSTNPQHFDGFGRA